MFYFYILTGDIIQYRKSKNKSYVNFSLLLTVDKNNRFHYSMQIVQKLCIISFKIQFLKMYNKCFLGWEKICNPYTKALKIKTEIKLQLKINVITYSVMNDKIKINNLIINVIKVLRFNSRLCFLLFKYDL